MIASRLPLPVLLLLLFAFARAGTAAETARKFDILQTEQARIDALVKHDYAALDRLLADDLLYTHSAGVVDTKSSFLEGLKDGPISYVAIAHKEEVVRIYGDAAIITGESAMTAGPKGQEKPIRLRFTIVYVQRDGRWQMVSWHSCRLPDESPKV